MQIKIYQIELTNYCNASCGYCPYKKMTRAKGFMTEATFRRCMEIMKNKYVALHHFGEPFLHPNLVKFIRIAQEEYGKIVELSTNGKGLNSEGIKALMQAKPYRIRVAWDFFKPVDTILKLLSVNVQTIVTVHSVNGAKELLSQKDFCDFAGQVEVKNKKNQVCGDCYFKLYNWYVVLWDGRVVPCCVDFDGKEVIGDVFSGISPKDNYKLCRNCGGMQFAEGGLWHLDNE